MPIYKKQKTLKKSSKKRRNASLALVPRDFINSQKQHRHVRNCSTSGAGYEVRVDQVAGTLGNIRVAGAAGPNLQWSFSLGEVVGNLGGVPRAIVIPIPGFTELSTLYDCYQLERVDVEVFNNMVSSELNPTYFAGSGHAVGMPLLGMAVDNDDSAATTLQDLQQYSTFKIFEMSKPLRQSLVPLVATTLFSSPLSSYGRTQKQDVDCTYPNAPHYGLKMALDTMIPSVTFSTSILSFNFRLHYIMKCTR